MAPGADRVEAAVVFPNGVHTKGIPSNVHAGIPCPLANRRDSFALVFPIIYLRQGLAKATFVLLAAHL
jgi:hypothetical protein